jgi:hypothetical protein
MKVFINIGVLKKKLEKKQIKKQNKKPPDV